jgi:hypothetical protein
MDSLSCCYLLAHYQTPQDNVKAMPGIRYNPDGYKTHDDTSYGIYTDIMEIYANAANTQPCNTLQFIPRNEWLKLPQEQRDEIISKHRSERYFSTGFKSMNQKGTVSTAELAC